MTAMMRTVLALAVVWTAAAAPGDSALFAPPDVAAIAGDGRLTLGVNASGRVTTCRWPSPGFFEQIKYETGARTEPMLGVEPWHGAAWALELDHQLIWMHDDRWTHSMVPDFDPRIIEIESTFAARDLRVRQRYTVAESGSAFEARITVGGDVDVPPRVYWYANFSPTTRLIPHIPASPAVGEDFAAFVDRTIGAIVHFRPKDPASHQWRAARGLAEGDESYGDWRSFAMGCYAIAGTPNRATGMTAGVEEGPTSVVEQVNAANLSEQSSAAGKTASAIAMQVESEDEGYTARVITAFGTTYEAAAQQYNETRNKLSGVESESPPQPTSDVEWILHHAMTTIRTCTDAASGSVIRSPSNTPAFATDSPRYGVWIAAAFDAAAEPDRARGLLTFYANHVRGLDGADLPFGVVPAALYTNGVEAAPGAIVDAAATGRLLWAIDRYGSQRNAEDMQTFYRSVWQRVDDLANFLVIWREPGGTAPLYTFDYEAKRDRRTTELYVASYLGMRSAARISHVLKESRPDWEQAANELRDALRLHALHPDGAVAIQDPGALYGTQLIPEADLFDWPRFIRETLQETGGRFDVQSLQRLCGLVLSARDIPEDLRNETALEVRRYLARATPDSAEAAFAYLIADKLRAIEAAPPRPISEVSPGTP